MAEVNFIGVVAQLGCKQNSLQKSEIFIVYIIQKLSAAV
jgi:hypothetical protein